MLASVGEVVCGGDLVAGKIREFGMGVLSSVYRPLSFTYLNREVLILIYMLIYILKFVFPSRCVNVGDI